MGTVLLPMKECIEKEADKHKRGRVSDQKRAREAEIKLLGWKGRVTKAIKTIQKLQLRKWERKRKDSLPANSYDKAKKKENKQKFSYMVINIFLFLLLQKHNCIESVAHQ